MRLMVATVVLVTVSACSNRSFTPTVPASLAVGTPYTVLAGTTRAQRPDGSFGYDRSERLRWLDLTVSIPPSHDPGDLNFAYANPRPETEFTMAARNEFGSGAAFRAEVNRAMARRPVSQREVVVFVHGYNATQAETAFRAAQLAHDIKLPGALAIYSWPSRGKALGYAYDLDSLLFARAGLEEMLLELQKTDARSIILVAHSMGSLLVMETLRQMDRRQPGWAAASLGGVILMSPDIDIEVFRAQMNDLSKVPRPFVVFVSEKDKILNISGRLRGTADRQRLGNIKDVKLVADLPIDIIDATAFSDDAQSTHFVAATSPALISIFNDVRIMNNTLGEERVGIEALLPGDVAHQQGGTAITLSPAEEGAL